MTESVAIIIGTYGHSSWERRGVNLALKTNKEQCGEYGKNELGIEVIHEHDTSSLITARNMGARRTEAEWLIFLDADDSLGENYVEHMRAGTYGDIRQPSTLGVYPDGSEDDFPVLIPKKDLRTSNYVVIGAMCRHSIFENVGGFREYEALEDWELWLRMTVKGGAKIDARPEAIYRVGVNDGGRNSNVEAHARAYKKITMEYRYR